MLVSALKALKTQEASYFYFVFLKFFFLLPLPMSPAQHCFDLPLACECPQQGPETQGWGASGGPRCGLGQSDEDAQLGVTGCRCVTLGEGRPPSGLVPSLAPSSPQEARAPQPAVRLGTQPGALDASLPVELTRRCVQLTWK